MARNDVTDASSFEVPASASASTLNTRLQTPRPVFFISTASAMRASILHSSLRSHRFLLSNTRHFSSHPILRARNRIYPARVRNEEDLHTLILSRASSRVPLVTLWMTTWSRDCDVVSAIVKELLEQDGIGEDKGSVGFVEVEMDSPDLGGVSGIAQRYLINDIPTLLAFDRQEAQLETKVRRMEDLKSREFLVKWIEKEAARHGEGGAGGRFWGLFGR